MKKSQLKNIIRESIKSLMTEQLTFHHRFQGYGAANGDPSSCTQSGTVTWTINGSSTDFYQAVGSPSVGQFVGMEIFNFGWNGYGCWKYVGTSTTPVTGVNTSQHGLLPATAQSGTNDCPSCYCHSNNPYSHSNCPTSTSGCDPNGPFPGNFNLSSWTSQWTNSGPFNNTTNANQPCNFICGKVTVFQNNLALNPGPAQTNMLECKLEEAMSQYATHGCAQVNSNNCPI